MRTIAVNLGAILLLSAAILCSESNPKSASIDLSTPGVPECFQAIYNYEGYFKSPIGKEFKEAMVAAETYDLEHLEENEELKNMEEDNGYVPINTLNKEEEDISIRLLNAQEGIDNDPAYVEIIEEKQLSC